METFEEINNNHTDYDFCALPVSLQRRNCLRKPTEEIVLKIVSKC